MDNFTQLNSQAETSNLTINGVNAAQAGPATVQIGNLYYSLSGFQYNAPTVSLSLTGSLTGVFTAVAVPEPASIVMMGLGLAGVFGFTRRRAAGLA